MPNLGECVNFNSTYKNCAPQNCKSGGSGGSEVGWVGPKSGGWVSPKYPPPPSYKRSLLQGCHTEVAVCSWLQDRSGQQDHSGRRLEEQELQRPVARGGIGQWMQEAKQWQEQPEDQSSKSQAEPGCQGHCGWGGFGWVG